MRKSGNWIAAPVLALVLAGCVNLKTPNLKWDPPPYYALENYTQIDGVKICYLEVNATAPNTIVFVHGLSGNVENWWDQFEDFRDDYHVLAPDLPGHGKSGKPEDFDYSVPSFAKVIIALMDERGIQKATIVGNSLGGAIAAYIAVQYPDRVDKLVLSDSAGLGVSPLLKAVAPLATPYAARLMGVTSARQYPGTSPKQKARADFSASFRNTEEEPPYLVAVVKSLRQVSKFNIEKSLGQIKAPTLIIWGDNDSTVPVKNARVFNDLIAGSALYMVKEGGHTPNMQLPQEFDCAVKNFLAGNNLDPCRRVGDAERDALKKEQARK